MFSNYNFELINNKISSIYFKSDDDYVIIISKIEENTYYIINAKKHNSIRTFHRIKIKYPNLIIHKIIFPKVDSKKPLIDLLNYYNNDLFQKNKNIITMINENEIDLFIKIIIKKLIIKKQT